MLLAILFGQLTRRVPKADGGLYAYARHEFGDFRGSPLPVLGMMHGSTSPLYQLIASCDVATAMLEGPGGRALTGEALDEAVTFRRAMVVRLLDEAFGTLPVPVLPPGRAYQLLVRDQVEWVAVDDMGGRVTAVMVVPYPPGIPLLMPGEHAGDGDGPVLGYLKALQDLDRKFPGFDHDIHGVQAEADGTYRIMCLKRAAVSSAPS